jgi:hypothetical protein
VRKVALALGVLLICAFGALAGYQVGRATGELDDVYLASLERINSANQAAIARLEARLVDADLARQVEIQAGHELRDGIRTLRDQVAALTEEVTFYKSLMAPSSVARGLQIADFELSALDRAEQFRFHLLLTQVEARRDWVQGEASLDVHGRMTGADSSTAVGERVLPLTDIGMEGTYPLKFRFRYFQDLTGVITLPVGFEPERIVVTAGKRGASAEPLRRTFEWTVAP